MGSGSGATGLLAQGVPNPWFSTLYLQQGRSELLTALEQHVTITVVSVLAGLALSLPLAVLARRSALAETLVIGGAGVIYTIPSLALFALLVPVTAYTATTATIALALYTLVILVRNAVTGLAEVPAEVVEAARGMGLSAWQRLLRVELPIALPSIVAGVRVATVSTISLLTVAAYVGTGGFGQLIDQGFRADYRAKIVTACLACVLLALVADALLVLLQRLLTPWTRTAR
ncbi:MAG: ABC transporter permease [Frankiales bacterium]|nr:ABC transporter permease [Frankiales bacterium]